MPRNGSGVYSVYTPGNPVVAGTTIDPTAFNNTTNDLATALTNSIASNGETPVTANLPMSGFKHTGAGAATVSGQYMTYGQAGNFTNIVAAGTLTGVTDLTTTGNTILGDATTDTLNVGANGLIKDASGNVQVGGAGARLLVGATGGGTGQIYVFKTGAVDVPIEMSTSTSFAIGVNTSASTNAWGAIAGSTYVGSAATALPLVILTNAAERMRFSASSGDITALGVAISRSKSATTSRASTTTLADDPHLVAPLGVGTWSVDVWVPIWATTGGAGGFKSTLAFSGTATSAAYAGTTVLNLTNGISSSTGLGTTFSGATITIGTGVTSGTDWVRLAGTVTVSVAGNLSLQWAQNSSSANAANVGIGGWMNCVKVG